MTQAVRKHRNDSITSLASDALREQFDDVKTRMSDIAEQAKMYTDEFTVRVEKHPIYAVAGATLVGFALGALFSRR
jgi:ElaB/YqjD/DUF883 family membrane-anchored ribosome-binding protein